MYVASSISAPVFLPEVMLGVTLFGFLLGVGQNVDIYGYIFKELCVRDFYSFIFSPHDGSEDGSELLLYVIR